MVDVVAEDVQRDVGDSLDNVAMAQAGGPCLVQFFGWNLAATNDDAACQLEDGVGAPTHGVGMPRIGDLLLGEPNLPPHEGMGAEAVTALIAFRDGERDLLAQLRVE